MSARPAASDDTLPLIEAREVARGEGWRVRRVVCRADPDTPLAEEQHEWTGVSVVSSGTFTYRSDAGRVLLAPGSLLLANAGSCFACGHEHGAGDTCISFQFDPGLVASAFGEVGPRRRTRFRSHVVPPIQDTLPFTARAGAIQGNGDVPPVLSSTAIWSPIPTSKEIGREEAFFRRADHRLPA